MNERQEEVTRILQSDRVGEDLLPLVYEELHALARGQMSRERAGHTLQATALVSEAYLRLVGDTEMAWKSRRHFYAAAGEAMRRVLVDHARRVRSQKRGGDRKRATLGAVDAAVELDADQVLALDDALEKLEAEDARAAAVTRLRFFAGLSVEETAQALETSARSVHREWAYARARLFELLEEH